MEGQRVLTSYGFGKITVKKSASTCEVSLEQPFLGRSVMMASTTDEIFPFTNTALARVLNIRDRGYFSNLQFLEQEVADAQFRMFAPPNETRFFLDLEGGTFQVRPELGMLFYPTLIMRPWIDRWAVERSNYGAGLEQALVGFQEEKESLTGAGGICAGILLNTSQQKIISLYILLPPPHGVIFEKTF